MTKQQQQQQHLFIPEKKEEKYIYIEEKYIDLKLSTATYFLLISSLHSSWICTDVYCLGTVCGQTSGIFVVK